MSQFSMKPQITRPPACGQGSGRHRFENCRRELGAEKDLGALCRPTRTPGWALMPGWLQGARGLPGARPGHSLLSGSLGTYAKKAQTFSLASPWGGCACPAGRGRGAGGELGPAAVPHRLHIDTPADSLAALLSSPSFQGDKKRGWGEREGGRGHKTFLLLFC